MYSIEIQQYLKYVLQLRLLAHLTLKYHIIQYFITSKVLMVLLISEKFYAIVICFLLEDH